MRRLPEEQAKQPLETETLSPEDSSLGKTSEGTDTDSFVTLTPRLISAPKFLTPEKLKKVNRSIVSYHRQELAKPKSNVPVREPLENSKKVINSDLKKQEKIAATWTKIVPFEKFNANLQISFGKAIARIKNSPENQGKYIIVADVNPQKPKSTSWIKDLLSKQIQDYPPADFVKPSEVSNYLKTHPKIDHVITIDDGAYSGTQMSETIQDVLRTKLDHNPVFHVVVPYMTSVARNKIKGALADSKSYFYDAERMLTYKEQADSHVFDTQYEFERSRILNLQETGDKDIDLELRALKQSLMQGSKSLSESESNQVVDFLRGLKGEKSASLVKSIYEMRQKPGFFKRLKTKIAAPNLNQFKEDSARTPTWMAHKAADDLSTDFDAMQKIVTPIPIAPYKNNEQVGKNLIERDNAMARYYQIERLKVDMKGRTLQDTVAKNPDLSWIQAELDFVQSNRGFFLLGDNYALAADNSRGFATAPGVTISHAGKVFNLGGDRGEYQYQLREGDIFTITNPKNPAQQATLRLVEGKLEKLS